MEGSSLAKPVASWREALLASALDAIIVMDTNGAIREFNHAAEETFGYRRDEAVGSTVAQTIVPPELREAHWAGLQRFLASGEGKILNRRVEIEGQRKDGQRFPVELTIVPFKADGVTMFAGYLRDITQRRQAEEDVRRANDLAVLMREIPLRAAKASSFTEAAGIALEQVCRHAGWPVGHAYILDPERNVLTPQGIWYIEDAQRFARFREVTDNTDLRLGEGLPGRAWQEDGPVWVEDIEKEVNFPRAMLARDLGVRGGLAIPVPVGGRTEAVLEFYTPTTRHPDDEIMRVTEALVHELGRMLERQRDRDELRKANERLAEMAGRRADFLNLAAHELKNPLTPLSLQLQMLPRMGPLNEQQLQGVKVMDASVVRLRQIVSDLLDGARAQSGTLRIDPRETEMAEVVRGVVQTYAPVARDKGVTVEQEGDEAVAVVDPDRLGQVVDNLLSNAIKFTPAGGRISIRVGTGKEHAWLEVEDTGAGIDPKDHSRLFQPFSQVHDQSRSLGGTGLGLYVCQAIMEAHGGRMGVESRGDGQGALFWAKWPARPAAEGKMGR